MIGAGSAARDGAGRAARDHGARVALVERTRWGGSCPNVACKPTKAYLVAADLVRDTRALGTKLGLAAPPAHVDLSLVRAWKDSLLRSQEQWRADLGERFDTVEGEATFVDARTVYVGDRVLRGDRALVATGSRTAVPDIPGLASDWLDHISALALDTLPASLLVLGGGPLGLEFAQMFRRFGSEVTLVQGPPRIAPRADEDAATALTAALEEEGIRVVAGTTVKRFQRRRAMLVNGETIDAERVFLASGRVPNVEGLGLEAIGVERHRGGIVVDEHLRTSVEGIWAAGDVTGVAQFTPIAQYQARIAIDDMFGIVRRADYAALPTTIFTDPELAAVGLTEAEAREHGHDVGTAVHPVTSVTRSQYIGERNGLYKLVYDERSRRVLGLHVVSRNASDIVQGLAIAFGRGVTVDELAAAHHVYPSWGEGVKGAAERVPARAAA